MRNKLKITWLCAAVMLSGCGDVMVPKPQGYFRIELPKHEYRRYATDTTDYTFEIDGLAEMRADHDRGAEKGWTELTYPTLKCKIHLTYLNLNRDGEGQSIENAMEDSHRLAYKHTVKADAIVERYYDDEEKNVHAVYYDIKGNAATPIQFAITDSLRRVFRGSLYFACRPNKDSLAPVVKYIEEDIDHLIETFEWEESSKKEKNATTAKR